MPHLFKLALLGALWFSTLALGAKPVASSSDGLITSKTKYSLWTTVGLKSAMVHVDTVEGRVTLHGRVPTTAQRALAAKTALKVSGVRSVANLLKVVPETNQVFPVRTDEELSKEASLALSTNPQLQGSGIRVRSVDRGVVLLTGDSRSYEETLRALATVDRLPGVRRIASEISAPSNDDEDDRFTFVGPAQAPAMTAQAPAKNSSFTDGWISAEVKARLMMAEQIPSGEINVDSDNGRVTLFGIVPTADVKAAAESEAKAVNGVTQVDNELQVVATAAKKAVDAKDTDISRDLALAFKDHSEYRSLSSSVKNGTVRLTGTVPSGWDRLKALRATRRIAGVRGIENDLKLVAMP